MIFDVLEKLFLRVFHVVANVSNFDLLSICFEISMKYAIERQLLLLFSAFLPRFDFKFEATLVIHKKKKCTLFIPCTYCFVYSFGSNLKAGNFLVFLAHTPGATICDDCSAFVSCLINANKTYNIIFLCLLDFD